MRTPDANYDKRSHELNFDAIASLTSQLRQARMVLCSAGGGTAFRVQDLMQPVGNNLVVTRHEHVRRDGNAARHLIGPSAVSAAQYDARFGVQQMSAYIFACDAQLRAVPFNA